MRAKRRSMGVFAMAFAAGAPRQWLFPICSPMHAPTTCTGMRWFACIHANGHADNKPVRLTTAPVGSLAEKPAPGVPGPLAPALGNA